MNTTDSKVSTGSNFVFRGNMEAEGFAGVVTRVEDGWFWYRRADGTESAAPSPVGLFSTPQWSIVPQHQASCRECRWLYGRLVRPCLVHAVAR